TFIIVTHDQEEAMTVADRIGVMNEGRLVQVGTPPDVYEQPTSRWVADFIGDVNLIEGRVVAADDSGSTVESATAGTLRAASTHAAKPGGTVWIALRPEKLRIAHGAPADAAINCMAGDVVDIGYLGDLSIYKVRLAGGFVMTAATANMTRHLERPIGWDDR